MSADDFREDDPTKKEAILKAAEEIFARDGFDSARLEDIADRADVDRKLIHYYFGRKGKLYESAFLDFGKWVDRGRAVGAFAAAGDGSAERLARWGDLLSDFGALRPHCVTMVVRDLFEGGPRMKAVLGEQPLAAGLARSVQQIEADRARGALPDLDPRHLILYFASLHLPYFAIAPFLGAMFGEDLLSPAHVARHKAEARRLLLEGIQPKETEARVLAPPRDAGGPEEHADEETVGAELSWLLSELRRLERSKKGTWRRILEAATGFFTRHGFDGASTREIAKEAGVDKKMIAEYFGDKEGAYASAAAFHLWKHVRAEGDPSTHKGSLDDMMDWFTDATHAAARANPGGLRFLVRNILDNGPVFRRLFGPLIGHAVRTAQRMLQEHLRTGKIATGDTLHLHLCVISKELFYYATADFFGPLWGVDFLAAEQAEGYKRAALQLLLRGVAPRA